VRHHRMMINSFITNQNPSQTEATDNIVQAFGTVLWIWDSWELYNHNYMWEIFFYFRRLCFFFAFYMRTYLQKKHVKRR